MLYYVVVGIIALIIVFIMIEISYYNKFQLFHIKISEAFNNIDILFEKKLNLLERCVNIIRDSNKKYKDENLLDNLVKLKNKKINRFDLNHELTLALREYYSLLDLDKKLSEIEALKNINEDLVDIDNDLNAAKKYYNDNVVLHNNLVKCFPSNLVAKICHYKREEFFKEEKIETLEILKEK
jgi:LemA protein